MGKQIKHFQQSIENKIAIGNRPNQHNVIYINIQSTETRHLTRLQLETETTKEKSFQRKSDHPKTSKAIRKLFKIQTSEKEDPARMTAKYIPPSL